ncbi:hypothetical protein AVEN_263766-1 [Araneus ventricosus]|uniref:Uncharacterized protein n=1 Tax=Araneus ventricosus TaxID=182803 RepID=A0A4Y2ATX4_ARAVE|nr:hypothetical protein AVEN_263766-1 [Araneus ventricosus]
MANYLKFQTQFHRRSTNINLIQVKFMTMRYTTSESWSLDGSLSFLIGGSWIRDPAPPEIRCIHEVYKVSDLGPESSRFETRFHPRSIVYVGLVHDTSNVEDQTSSPWCGAEFWIGAADCRPRHLTMVQNYKDSPTTSFVWLQ